jgi:hypothetical protein
MELFTLPICIIAQRGSCEMTKKTRYFLCGSAAILLAGLMTGLVAYYNGSLPVLSASDRPTELKFVPADAAVIAYADGQAIMNSELRARLKQIMPLHEKGQDEFQRETGINIETDIDYLIAAMSPPGSNRTPPALLVARGRFNTTQLESLARQHGGSVAEYRGKRLVATSNRGANSANGTLAFLEPGLVAVGESESVRKAIDAAATGTSVTSNEEMMALVSDIERTNNAWAVGRFDILANQANLPEQIARQMPAVKWFAAAGHINGGLSGMLRAEARDDQAAEHLRNVVRGIMSLGQLQAQNDPRTAALINSVQLTGTGKTVQLSFTVPAELLEMAVPKTRKGDVK